MKVNFREESKDNKRIHKTIKILLAVILGIIIFFMINLVRMSDFKIINLKDYYIPKYVNYVMAILAIISCWMYYYTYKKNLLFLVVLIYTSFGFEFIYTNILIGKMSAINTIFYSFTIFSYMFRTIFVTLMIMKPNRLSKFISKNKVLTLVVTVFITKFLIDIEVTNKIYYFSKISWYIILIINLLLGIYHFIVLFKLSLDSLKYNETIYTIVIASLNFFVIRRFYGFRYIYEFNYLVYFYCNFFTFMGFLTLILGTFAELVRKVRESEKLKKRLTVFYAVAEDNSHNNILIYNEYDKVIYANKKTRELFDIKEDESGYKSLEIKLKETVDKEQLEYINNKLINKSTYKENLILTNGDIIEVDIQKIQVDSNEKNKVVVFRDITEEYNVSQQLRVNEQRLTLITENIMDLIFTVNIDGIITYINSAVTNILGYTSEEIIGTNYLDILDITDERSVSLMLDEGEKNLVTEHRVRRKDGKIIIVESVVSTITYHNGQPIGRVIVSRDLEYRNDFELLKIKYEEVKEYERIKNEFFANLSHELRTPINILYSCIQLLNFKKTTEKEEFLSYYEKYEKTMKQNCFRMLRLVNNLIDITKIDSGFMKMDFINYDIVKLVEDITMSVIPYVEAKKIDIIFDTEIEELEIRCDPDKIERVILNLLSNAVKFTNVYGKIEVNVSLKDNWVEISVKDDGIGIPAHMKDFIFERFVQTDKSFNRIKEGSGIGLALVRSLIELHGGKVYLNNTKQGSEFIVMLPNIKDKNYKIDDGKLEYEPTVEKICIEFADIYDLY